MTTTITATPTISVDSLTDLAFAAWTRRPEAPADAMARILHGHGVVGLADDQIRGIADGLKAMMFATRSDGIEADVAQVLWDNGVHISPAERAA